MHSQHEHDDPYRILDVAPTASAQEILLAYRKRAMLWHPDRNTRPDAHEHFRRVRFAYEILRDPQRRAEYDRAAAVHAARPRTHPDRAAASASGEPKRNGAVDVRRRVRITLDEQRRGGPVEIDLRRTHPCSACNGTGVRGKPVRCAKCSGTGRATFGLFPFVLATAPCASCDGEGVVVTSCGACSGKGSLGRQRGRLRFELPPGVPPGGILRVRGHGRRGRNGKSPGDLVIEVAIAAHPLFEPDYPHLRCEMPVSVFRALAGGHLDVPTLDDPVAVRLPPDARDGMELRVAGQGMMNAADGERGDLLVRLRLVRPHKLSAAHRDLLAQLERLAMDEPAHAAWARRCAQAQRLRRRPARQRDAE